MSTVTRNALEDALLDDDFLAGPDEDSFGALGSTSLDAEFEYALADADEDEDDDEFGGDYEWFGATGEPDDFESIEREVDAEFGSWYGFKGSLAPAEGITTDQLELIAGAFGFGANLAWFSSHLPQGVQNSPKYRSAMQKLEALLEWVQSAVTGDEASELAIYLTNEPGFGYPVTAEMVEAAVKKAAVPGMEAAWDEPLKEWWKSEEPGWWNWLKAAPGAAVDAAQAYLTTDVPTAIRGTLDEVGINVGDDQIINSLAISYWLTSWNPLVGDNVYEWLAQEINDEAGRALSESEVDIDVEIPGSVAPVAYVPTAPVAYVPMDVAPPSSGMGLPEPQTILGVGYGAMALAAILGFK